MNKVLFVLNLVFLLVSLFCLFLGVWNFIAGIFGPDTAFIYGNPSTKLMVRGIGFMLLSIVFKPHFDRN